MIKKGENNTQTTQKNIMKHIKLRMLQSKKIQIDIVTK